MPHAWCAVDSDVQGERVACLCGAPLIAMMETTDFGDRDDRPDGCSRDRSVIWRVLVEAEVRSTPMIVPAVGREDAPEMGLVDDDHVIEALSSDRANQPFDVRILPRTRRRRDDFSNAHACQPVLEDLPVDAVAISVQPARRCVVWKCVDHLLSGPSGRRMIRDVDMHDTPAVMRQHDQNEQHASGERRHGEEIHRRGRSEVIRKERPPSLRRRTRVPFQQTRDCAF
jgi:hypothetical protein